MALFDSHERYANPQPLGSGGMGTVFKVFDKKLNRHVAVKVMNAVVFKEEDVKRFEREAQSLAHMQHPHICPIHDFDRIDGHPCLVMDLIVGRSLQDILEKSWPPPNRDIAKWIWQVARALRHAHAKNVRHRDIKPANIMINAEGDAILMDFGLAQSLEATESLTQSGGFMGTPAYASPEQLQETKSVDDRADIYSLGVVLFELLCRNRPFKGNALSIMRQMQACETIPQPSDHYDQVVSGLETICLKATALPLEARYQSMDEFAGALESYVNQETAALVGVITSRPPTSRLPDGPSQIEDGNTTPLRSARNTVVSESTVPAVSPQKGAGTSDGEEFRPVSRPNDRRIKPWAMAVAGISIIVAFLIWYSKQNASESSATSPDDLASSSEREGSPNPPPTESLPNTQKPEIGNTTLERPALLMAPFDADAARRTQEAWAKFLGLSHFIQTNTVGMKMVLIPPGEFPMGSTPEQIEQVVAFHPPYGRNYGADEQPQHPVRITQPILMGQYEVTNGQFADFVKEMAYQTEAEADGMGGLGWNAETGEFEGPDPKYNWRNPGFPQDASHPVSNISWNDALKFCEWLSKKDGANYRLPTEAEWEYACRAGTVTHFYHGDDPEGLAQVGNISDATAKRLFPDWPAIASDDAFLFTAPVGKYRPNAFELYDMHGNIWEWCADWFASDYYADSPTDDPKGPAEGTDRVSRSGGWGGSAKRGRSANRTHAAPSERSSRKGFRVVAVLQTQ